MWLLCSCDSGAFSDSMVSKKAKADNRTHVCFGSLADICTAKAHVCFTSESGHSAARRARPLRAKSGHPSLDMAYREH